VFDLDRPSPLKSGFVLVLAESKGVPEAERILHAELSGRIERCRCGRGITSIPQRRICIQGPIAPRAACQAVLIEHPDDRHHRKPAIGDL